MSLEARDTKRLTTIYKYEYTIIALLYLLIFYCRLGIAMYVLFSFSLLNKEAHTEEQCRVLRESGEFERILF